MTNGDIVTPQMCSIARTLEVVGDAWTLLVVRDLAGRPRRFDELIASLGIARNVLTTRLRKLEECGIVEAVAYQERPPRFEYRLTTAGRELRAILIAMLAWGDRWTRDAGDPPPVEVRHAQCDTRIAIELRCPACERSVAVDDVRSHRTRPPARREPTRRR